MDFGFLLRNCTSEVQGFERCIVMQRDFLAPVMHRTFLSLPWLFILLKVSLFLSCFLSLSLSWELSLCPGQEARLCVEEETPHCTSLISPESITGLGRGLWGGAGRGREAEAEAQGEQGL